MEDKDDILNKIPTEIYLHVGEIVGEVEFKDLKIVLCLSWKLKLIRLFTHYLRTRTVFLSLVGLPGK